MRGWQLIAVVSRDGAILDTLRLSRTPVSIGSSPKCDIVLSDPHVSWNHAHVTVSAGRLLLVDASRNGTFHQGARVSSLDMGESGSVEIPPFDLQFRIEETAGAPQTLLRNSGPGPSRDAPRTPAPEDPDAELAVTKPVRAVRTGRRVTRKLKTDGGLATPLPTPAPITPVSEPAATPAVAATPLERRPGDAELGATMVAMATPTILGESPSTFLPFRLTLVKGPRPLQGLAFAPSAIVVSLGRSPECGFPIDHPTVSRRHAEFHFADGTWHVRDLGSRNGTLVNGRPIQDARLADGDTVAFGNEIAARFSVVQPGSDRVPPHAGAAPDMPDPQDAQRLRVQRRRAAGDDRVVLLQVTGRVDGFTYSELRDCLTQALETGVRALVVDLTQCGFFDHAGLGVLVNAQTQLSRSRGQLIVVGASQRLLEGMELLRLGRLIRIAPDEGTAVAELQRILD